MVADSAKATLFAAPWKSILWRVLGLGLLLGLALALTMLPLSSALLLVIGSVFALLVLVNPRYGVYLLVFAIPYRSIREIHVSGLSITATEVVSLLVVVSWIAQQIRRREPLWQSLKLGGAIGLFLGALALSTLVAGSLKDSLKVFAEWGEFAVAYWLATMMFQKSSHLWLLIALLLVASASQAAYGLVQFFVGIGPASFIKAGGLLAASGTFDQPNPYGGYLNYTLPLALSLALYSRHSVIRRAGLILVLVIAAGLAVSLSRGAWLGALGAAVVVFGFGKRRGALLAGVGIVALIWLGLLESLALLPFSILDRLLSSVGLGSIDINHVTPANFSPVERLAHWIAGLRMFAAHPLLGVGIGNYPVVYDQYRLEMWQAPLGHAHNYYINIAAETGLIGELAYLFLLVSAFLLACQTVVLARQMLSTKLAPPILELPVSRRQFPVSLAQRWQKLSEEVGLADYFAVSVGLLGGLTAVSIHNLVDDLYVHGMTIELGLLLAALTIVTTQIQNWHRLPSTSPPAIRRVL